MSIVLQHKLPSLACSKGYMCLRCCQECACRAIRLVQEEVDRILDRDGVRRYLRVRIRRQDVHTFRQDRPGRPSEDTRYVRRTRRLWRIEWTLDEDRIEYDRRSDGIYPLLTNDRSLAPRDVFLAHKRQPAAERRFGELKSGLGIAPAFLKIEARIEAFFLLEFLALLVRGLIERELRRAMDRGGVASLPLRASARSCPPFVGECVSPAAGAPTRVRRRAGFARTAVQPTGAGSPASVV